MNNKTQTKLTETHDNPLYPLDGFMASLVEYLDGLSVEEVNRQFDDDDYTFDIVYLFRMAYLQRRATQSQRKVLP